MEKNLFSPTEKAEKRGNTNTVQRLLIDNTGHC